MDLATLLRVLIRRWPTVLVLTALTIATGWGVARSIAPTYEANAAVLLLAPTTDASNPFSGTTRGLESTATAMALVMNGPEVVEIVDNNVGDVTYEVRAAEATAILGIDVEGEDPAVVLDAQDEILAVFHEQLLSRQTDAGIRENDLVRDSVLTKSTSATIRFGSRDRALAAIALLGLLATISAALIAERIAIRRSAKRLIEESRFVGQATHIPPPTSPRIPDPITEPIPQLDDQPRY